MQETINFIIETEKRYEGLEMPSEIKNLISMRKSEVFNFENEVFEYKMRLIRAEKKEIDYLNKTKDDSSSKAYVEYAQNEIANHQNKITELGKDVFSMYSREALIDVYVAQRVACEQRIEFNNNELKKDPNDQVAALSLKSDLGFLKSIDYSISILNGTAPELMNSYINTDQIGTRNK